MSYKTKIYGRVRISLGNTKLGLISNVSTTPIRGCGPKIPCGAKCYAMKAYRMYPSVQNAWDQNLALLELDQDAFLSGVDEYLADCKPRYFRWWVSGDTPNQAFLSGMFRLARRHPDVRFLLFTKRHDLDYRRCPSNLAAIFSMWPRWGNTRKKMVRAWMRDKDNRETRVPADAIECPGHCETCGMCWQLPKMGRDVVFIEH